VHAVYPAGPHPSPKVRVFSEYLSAQLGGTTEANAHQPRGGTPNRRSRGPRN
jgi:hypothetical protein